MAIGVALIYLVGSDLNHDMVGASFALLLFQSILMLGLAGSKQIALIQIYFVFGVMFFSVAPWMQYSNQTVLWGGGGFSTSDYLTTNTIIFLSNLIVFFSYSLFYGRANRFASVSEARDLEGGNRKVRVLTSITLVLVSATSFFGLLYLNGYVFEQLFFRGLLDDQFVRPVESSSLSLILSMVTRLLPLFCFLYSCTRSYSDKLTNTTLFLLLLICVFPTGAARYMVAFVYIPVCLLLFNRLRSALTFSTVLFFSLIFVFPFLNQFRYFDAAASLKLLPEPTFFLGGHFDAYQNFMRAIQVDFITYGSQLLGVVFFFVPRTFWAGKPYGSGYEMSLGEGLAFSNISMPFLGEGYVNIGVLGVFVFSFVIAAIMGRLDKAFLGRVATINRPDYSGAVYFYLCGALIFMLRGDLLSSFAYITSGLFCAVFVYSIAQFVRNLIVRNSMKHASFRVARKR